LAKARGKNYNGSTVGFVDPNSASKPQFKSSSSSGFNSAAAVARRSLKGSDDQMTLYNFIYNSIEAPSSPTSMSMTLLDAMLKVSGPKDSSNGNSSADGSNRQDTASTSSTNSEHYQAGVPFECLQFYRFLNDSAKKNIMKQLVSRFQRTSCTPRNITLNTPRYARSVLSSSVAAVNMMNLMLPGYSDNADNAGAAGAETVDPNLFEMDDDEGDAEEEDTNHQQPTLSQAPSKHHHKFSPDDEAAMEAAVEIALLLSHSNNKNAETLFKSVLTDNYEKLSATAVTIRSEMSKGGAL